MFPPAAASSASWTILSTKFLFSVLMFLFTSLFAFVYSFRASFFAALVRQLVIIAAFLTVSSGLSLPKAIPYVESVSFDPPLLRKHS